MLSYKNSYSILNVNIETILFNKIFEKWICISIFNQRTCILDEIHQRRLDSNNYDSRINNNINYKTWKFKSNNMANHEIPNWKCSSVFKRALKCCAMKKKPFSKHSSIHFLSTFCAWYNFVENIVSILKPHQRASNLQHNERNYD